MDPLSKETIGSILELTGGDDSILIELFESFLVDAKELSTGISNATVSKDWEKLKFDVHTLKGLCGTIGANPLFEICKTLNEQIKDGSYNNVNLLVGEVDVKYRELVNYITSNYNIEHAA